MISVPLRIIDLHDDGFHPLVEVVLFEKTFIMVLDTGASKTAFDQTVLSEANETMNILASDKLSTGLGTNTMESFTATVSDLHIGDLPIAEFEVAVLDLSTINAAYGQMGHPQVLGVLGGDILMKYKAVIDYGKRVLKLKKVCQANAVPYLSEGKF
ncbi:clan AA aspartic protease [Mucilaginibacter rubeus]|uniref:Aspartyl protease family protein n=1 Tax=Mucilaginibacter rubeus TaxID=2027860 RepID=A0AAE6JM97_9SPHI|nr:aspartyl protease family protein [Mucilaginibacter rubeus]QEM20765.1 clan AA aspartic protease [Mucilaginibacter gossypii]QEM08324.1 clan AA aspartic protease [Mucilaginibacter rubeus]QTE46989.1 aspartyl protease family protein [Mucilaginibacter rubeus]QTE53591.1 aspartyl protease family protein [Mucilaginibacter rubeus]QTE60092.1 aspartyl protease family protein [Mucilaginibacter rubeus]